MLAPGVRLGDRYELEEPVARGGMGEVWRAQDPVLGRTVAVKVLLSSLSKDPGFAERFRTEARAMAALSDPSIVEIYDYGQSDGVMYLVMPFVTGESLHDLLNRVGALPARAAMDLVTQAAHALHQAHRCGIVHRDVKPSNLLVRPDGRLMLTDFGIARAVAAEPVTAGGGVMGTAAYLAPEQVSGTPVLPTTDVYALGVVAYECLTLTQPFVAESPVSAALVRTREDPQPLPDSIPASVRHVVMRALAKNPEDRWPTAQAMAEAATDATRGLPEVPWIVEAPVAPPNRHPTPTASLPPIEPRPRTRAHLWAGLIPIAAGVALLIAATAFALGSLSTQVPSGVQVPPANSGEPGEGTFGNPQPTEPQNEDGARNGDDGVDDGDNSGPGGGGGGSGSGRHSRGSGGSGSDGPG